MTSLLIACAAAVAAVALLGIVFLLVRRNGGSGDERLESVVAQINDRMESMVRELSDALERAQEENRRTRVLGELGGSIDLDEVLTRTLEATGALPGVDAAIIAVDGGNTVGAVPPIVSTLGLSLGEAAPPALIEMMLGRPGALKLVPPARPLRSPLCPSRPCHWKPKSAESLGVTSTIMLSM